MRRKAKIDDNQPEIVRQLRTIPGLSVTITSSLGGGFVDLVLGYRQANYLVEIKDGSKPPSRQRLTPDEQAWHNSWQGQKAVCRSFDEVLALLKL